MMSRKTSHFFFASATMTSLSAAAFMWSSAVFAAPAAGPRAGEFKQDIPMFTMDDVRAHRSGSSDGRIYTTFRHGVYDITDFVENHPGGEKILMSAGNSLETFWRMYPQHMTPEVVEILESLRIGNLKDAKVVDTHTDSKELWKNEPERHPALVTRSATPFNAETPASMLQTFITPNDLYFVRNHVPVPVVDKPDEFRLHIDGEGVRQVSFSLEDLKSKFTRHTVTSTIQCSGNRRSGMKDVAPVRGLMWESGAISTSTWSGARLRDVLEYAGFSANTNPSRHIIFQGLDGDMSTPYEVSIPIHKAMSEYGDVLVAYEMNGEPIPRDHGYPLRAVVPGTVGARNCKWLSRIIPSETESQAVYQQKDYKSFPPGTSMARSHEHVSIQDMPVQSAITEPAKGTRIDGSASLKGWAWSGGGRGINRVDLTTDKGSTWKQADLHHPNQEPGRVWAWTQWEANVDVPKGTKSGDAFEVCARAVDSSCNVQPERAAPMHHIRGMLNNSWYCVDLVAE